MTEIYANQQKELLIRKWMGTPNFYAVTNSLLKFRYMYDEGNIHIVMEFIYP